MMGRSAKFLIGCLVVALLPSATSRRARRRLVQRSMQEKDLPIQAELFQQRKQVNGFPGPVFFSDEEVDQAFLAQEVVWQAEPRQGKGSDKSTKAPTTKWKWKKDCKSAKKSTKAPSTYSTKAPSGKGSGKGSRSTWGCDEDGAQESTPTPAPVAPTPPTPGTEGVRDSKDDDPSIDVPSPDSDTCSNIEDQDPPRNPSGVTSDYEVTLDLSYDPGETSQSEVLGVVDSVSPVIALWVAGCESEAFALADTLRRRLQDGTIEYVGIAPYRVVGGNCGVSAGEDCKETFATDVEVTADASVGQDVILGRLQEAFDMFGGLIGEGNNIEFNGSKDVTVEPDDDFNRIIEAPGAAVADDSVNVATVIGAAAGGLALLLLLVLLVRRSQTDEEVSHLKLDDEGDDTFIREFDSSSKGSAPNYETRNVHVVGEADSIFSGWTGYTPNSTNGIEVVGFNAHEKGDVHRCSSATCEVCERKRQQGIQFIPTGTPTRPQQIPSDAAREYVSNDTVDL